tara:strand:+ start:297 stop:806 length:510 start_codon:yes stop_codon:yes gene_type:complete
MGLFDAILKPGQKFSKDELWMLDQNFNSISVYTKRRYQFYSRDVANDIQGSMSYVSCHNVYYHYQDIDKHEDESDAHLRIYITKYYVKDKNDLHNLDNFYNNLYDLREEHRIPPPKLNNYPTYILKVGAPNEGFMIELKYQDGRIEQSCINELKDKSAKYLKEIHKIYG